MRTIIQMQFISYNVEYKQENVHQFIQQPREIVENFFNFSNISAVLFLIQQIYNHYLIFFEYMSDISLGIHPRQQSARKQFTQQQVKYFYNSNIFEDRRQNYDPSLFDRNQQIKQAKTHQQTYSPPICSKVQRINSSPQSQKDLDIITGLPTIERKMFLSKKPNSKPLQEKKEINQENKIQSKKEYESSPDKKFARLYFDNKKQYEQWLIQNKKYDDINYFKKKNTNQSNHEVEVNSYYKIHGKNCNQIQNK
ncbi:unnamed protein product [Paramecium sonneborni]|uniref:Uncharacterized protein n=1 Tax=Paramecium sonneborni TaxID=65129 RepID=A0A8S1JZ94_9CILI|nr:unnamed protein product [Paramecium sonneborni]